MKHKRGRQQHEPSAKPGQQASRTEVGPCDSTDIQRRWPVIALAGLTFLLSIPLFEPRSIWGFGYIVFVPWLIAVGLARRTVCVFLTSYLLGVAFFLLHFRWLYSTTPPGYFLLSLYLASCFPLAAWPLRHLHRRRGWNLTFLFPVVWTAVELLRSRGPLAFPWFLVGHSQIRFLTIIQMADLAGVLGVTFIVSMVNGWMADASIRLIRLRGSHAVVGRRLSRSASTATIAVLAATIIYGRVRLADLPVVEGPRVAVLQGDYVLSTEPEHDAPTSPNPRPQDDPIDSTLRALYRNGDYEADKRLTYLRLIKKAAPEQPDLVVLPETPWTMDLNRELRELPSPSTIVRLAQLQHEEFSELSDQYGIHLVVGALSTEPQPTGTYPEFHRYNSAFCYTPGASEPERYDKIHLVLFGEYVPFRYSDHLFWLYRFLNDHQWNPWGRGGNEYSLTPGTMRWGNKAFKTFPMKATSQDNATFHFGTTICYEDVIPQVFSRFVLDSAGVKRVDFMLNISNDGWFGRGTQQAQHLVACAFRAVENRVGIARAVNTGISGFIDPCGQWYSLLGASDTTPTVGGTGTKVARLRLDPRVTFYSRYGDVFAAGCAVLALAGTLDAVLASLRARRKRRQILKQGGKR